MLGWGVIGGWGLRGPKDLGEKRKRGLKERG